MSGNIWDHFVLALQSKPLTMELGSGGEVDLMIPSTIAYLIGYVLMQVTVSHEDGLKVYPPLNFVIWKSKTFLIKFIFFQMLIL